MSKAIPAQPKRSQLRPFEGTVGKALGRPVFAVAKLSLKSAVRYRLIQVLFLLLAAAVIGLPSVIKHDGTAQGFTQILLTYTLGAITVLLGFATLWIGCGSLSREVEECQIQMVATKPIQRWQIWLGKWLGILALNAILLTFSGATVYALIQFRSAKLPPEVKEQLSREIFTARGTIREASKESEIQAEAQKLYVERLKDQSISQLDRSFVRTGIVEMVKAQWQTVPAGYGRRWQLNFGRTADKVRDKTLTVRAKFFTSNLYSSKTYDSFWEVGPPDGSRARMELPSLAAETYHEFPLPPGAIGPDGTLTIDFYNPNETTLFFPLEEGLEVLYPESSFAINFCRALAIIFCWLALLAAIGLTTGSFLSFPVAAFCALGVLLVSSSTGTLNQIVTEQGIAGVNNNTGFVTDPGILNKASVSVAKSLLWTINLVRDFSPIESLSSGRSITWTQLAKATLQIVGLMGGIFAAIGISLFTRRELAIAQGA